MSLPLRLALASGIALLAGCASAPAPSVLLESDRDCPLNLEMGQLLMVSLPSNPASGYRWRLHDSAIAQLKPLGPEVFSNPKNDMVGGEGLSTWRFLVSGSGEGRLHLAYERPWDAAAEPMASFDCRIEVH